MTDVSVSNVDEKKNIPEEQVVLTEVTSIADEERKTGKKMELPSPEVIANNAMQTYLGSMRTLEQKLQNKSISKVSVLKGVMAGLYLPEENVPVHLKTNDEKEIFSLIQTAINCRYILTQWHIGQRKKEMLAEQNKEVVNES